MRRSAIKARIVQDQFLYAILCGNVATTEGS